MIFYLNLFKAIKFTLKVIFNFFAITADGELSIQLPTSYFVPKPQL